MFRYVTILIVLVLAVPEVWAVEPVLARLSFRLPGDRMAEFEAVYRTRIAPILKRHGLAESSRQGRATADSVFSRLIEVQTPSWIVRTQEALNGDSAWTGLLRDLGKTFGTAGADGLIRHHLGLYSAPAGHSSTYQFCCRYRD